VPRDYGVGASEEQTVRAFVADRKILSWALYDWGNSAFSTTVLAAFFPAFYKEYWSAAVAASTSTFQLGVGHALASALIVVLAPVLGRHRRQRWRQETLPRLLCVAGRGYDRVPVCSGAG